MKIVTHCLAEVEEVKDYYSTHSLNATAKYFNCNPDALNGFMKRNGIQKRKTSKKTYLKASYEEVYEYYVVQNHSEKETSKYFNCGITALENYLSRNNIKKDRKNVGKITSNVKQNKKEYRRKLLLDSINPTELINDFNSSLGVDYIKLKYHINNEEYFYLKNYYNLNFKTKKLSSASINLLSNFSKEDIVNYYINENHSLEECLSNYNIGRDAFLNVLKILNINKFTKLEDIIKSIDEQDFKTSLKKNLSIWELEKLFNINYWRLCSLIDYYNIDKNDIIINKKESEEESKFKFQLKENSLNFEFQYRLNNYRYDFKIENYLIEINPSYTHNSTIGYKKIGEPLEKNYHQLKTKTAFDNGYNCIHVWDWDDRNKIINLLKPREVIYARNTEIKEISKDKAKEYINKWHLQNYAKDSIRLGLYHNSELISVMTFGKPRYNKNYEWELIRYCAHKKVIGGAEKLFKYFINNYSPKSIISYCDNSKFKGKIYSQLGFNLKSFGVPSKHWYNPNNKIHITDNLLRQRGFDQLFGTSYGKGTSNRDLMLNSGFLEIYDCGQSLYEWRLTDSTSKSKDS